MNAYDEGFRDGIEAGRVLEQLDSALAELKNQIETRKANSSISPETIKELESNYNEYVEAKKEIELRMALASLYNIQKEG